MGLKSDIKSAFLKSMGNPEDEGNIDGLAQDLTNAVINFLQKQTFTITKMKASLEVEEISTTGFLSDITNLQAKTTSWPGGVTGPLQPVTIERLNLRKDGSIQGGTLKATGNAYIGRNPVPGGKTNETKTEVKLLSIERGTED